MSEAEGGRTMLPVRTTRGKRMNALLGEAAEADSEFWGQNFFAEEQRDEVYEQSDSETSVYDSDFSEQEPDDDDGDAESEEDEDAAERRRRKKKLLPPGRAKPKPKPKPRPADGAAAAGARPRRAASASVSLSGSDGFLIQRKSSRSSVMQATARHEEHRRMQEVEQRIRKFKRESDSFSRPKAMDISMEDLIKESCLATELHNAYGLSQLLEREEEAKRRHAAKSRKHYLGPRVRYHSFKGADGLARSELAYLDGAPFPETQRSHEHLRKRPRGTAATAEGMNVQQQQEPPKVPVGIKLKIRIKPPKL